MKAQWSCEEDILCGVNKPGDGKDMSELEKKHTPVISAPESVAKDEPFEVEVEIGKLVEHPNEPAHFIEWLELYCGDTFLGRAHFSGGVSYPQAVFRIKLSHAHGPLKVWEKCNIHGLWEAEKNIDVHE